ncbi:MAG: hypothetical protein QF613_03000 [Candidatus Marinimicrobia bacterium]|nr:hypothetical protein [Candidatus Neomarinimicrobiota bacterium]MDP6593162.1 hypothetical protein [Candidatus Neomarinimicrobiota bacterium]MDP6836033.1 hypothetical protein [Candidatus Neomarinimicrobiota bacterium]
MKTSIRIAAITLILCSAASAQFYFGRNKIQYHPFDWHVLTTPHFEIYYYKEEEELASAGAFFAEEAFSEMEKKFNFTLIKKVPLIFYSSHLHFQQTNTLPYLIPEGVGGFFEFIKGRVVIPYMGSTFQFKRVIRHELVHVFMHNKIGQILRMHNIQTYRVPPLWFTEGLAEFWANQWDSKTEMVIRDAFINDYLVPLDRLDLSSSGFLLYKEGQSFLRFIDESYGPEKILHIMENIWRDGNFYTVMESVLEKDFQEISDEWRYFYKKEIYPLLESSDTPGKQSQQITDVGINSAPVYYHGESDRVLYLSNRTGYSEIVLQSLYPHESDADAEVLIEGERTAGLESLHLLQTDMDVSGMGILIFSSKSGATDVLNFFHIDSAKTVATFRHPDLISIISPKWSQDESKVVFTGVDWRGYEDLYLLDRQTMELTRLTDDFYGDRTPSFSPDGRTVAFSSDRGQHGADGFFNIFAYDLEKGSIIRLTDGPYNDLSPDWSRADRPSILFSSDRDGVYNLWLLRDTGTAESPFPLQQSTLVPLTHFTTGAFDPRWAGENDQDVVFSAFEKFRFQIQLLQNATTLAEDGQEAAAIQTPVSPPWHREQLTAETKRSALPYRKRFTFDIAQTAIAYDPIFGFIGGAQVTVSDLLGNDYYHFLLFNSAQSSSEFSNRFNLAVTKVDISRRINISYGLFHFANDYFTYSSGFFFEQRYGGQFALSYPFSVFKRMEVTSSLWQTSRDYYGASDTFDALLVSNSASYVFDNSIWGPVGPIDGTSLRFTVGQTIDFSRSRIYYTGLLADYRKYFRTSLQTLYALRVMTWLNEGEDLFRFFIGGSWGIRGYERTAVSGKSFLMINNEFRFPFASQLVLRFPSVDFGLAPLRGALFFDLGNAWNDSFDGLLGSFGIGLRGNFLRVMVLRLDVGKTTDFHSVSKGLFTQFFFGWNY